MDTYTKLLVVILASVLAIMLVLAIIVLVKIIQIVNQVKEVVEKASKVADKAEAVGEFFQKTAAPIAISRLIANIVSNAVKAKRKKGKDDE